MTNEQAQRIIELLEENNRLATSHLERWEEHLVISEARMAEMSEMDKRADARAIEREARQKHLENLVIAEHEAVKIQRERWSLPSRVKVPAPPEPEKQPEEMKP